MLSHHILLQRARSAYQQERWAEAADVCQTILRTHKDDLEALTILHMLARFHRQLPEAIATGQKIITAAPRNPRGYMLLADYYVSCGDYKKATSVLEKWQKKLPNDLDAMVRFARLHDMQGDPESAKTLLQPLVDRGQETADMALLLATIAVQEKNPQHAAALLEKHLAEKSTDPSTAKDMCFALGLACERLGRNDDAFHWYSRGHEIMPYRFKLDDHLEYIERMIKTFSKERFERMPRARVETKLPIFLVCRPRSGSTLAERIIGSHPQVVLAGELNSITRIADRLNLLIGSTRVYPECILDIDQNDADALAREFKEDHQRHYQADRITIKHLDLWQHIGLISLLFPQATIIDLRRDAVDNCLACFSVHLGSRQPYGQDLRTLGAVHKSYERLMDHWYSLGIKMLRVDYEAIVADQETWSRKLIEYCGLPWDDRCLRFHENVGATAGTTLSYQQVRQPIYKSSVNRAAKFEKHLGPLYEALGIAPSDRSGGQ